MLGLARLRLFETIHSDDRLLLYRLDAAHVLEPVARSDVTFREAAADDAHAYARDIGTDAEATFRGRLSDATRCWLVLEGDRVVHSSWSTAKAAWTREVRRYFAPPEGEAYMYESYTRPEVRGRGIYPYALANIALALRRLGARAIWIGAEAHNAASIKSIAKAGFAPVCAVTYRRRLGFLAVDPATGQRATECAGCLVKKVTRRGSVS